MFRNTLLVLALFANVTLAGGAPLCCVVPIECCGKTDESVLAAVTEAPVSCCTHCPAPANDEGPVVSGDPCACHPNDHAILAHLDVPMPEVALALSTLRTDSAADLVGATRALDARSVRSACAGRTPPLRL